MIDVIKSAGVSDKKYWSQGKIDKVYTEQDTL
jgi:hypothetical protein